MSTVNYNEDMRKAFPDKELKQPKKQDVVVENNNINNMEDDSMLNNIVNNLVKALEEENKELMIQTTEQFDKLNVEDIKELVALLEEKCDELMEEQEYDLSGKLNDIANQFKNTLQTIAQQNKNNNKGDNVMLNNNIVKAVLTFDNEEKAQLFEKELLLPLAVNKKENIQYYQRNVNQIVLLSSEMPESNGQILTYAIMQRKNANCVPFYGNIAIEGKLPKSNFRAIEHFFAYSKERMNSLNSQLTGYTRIVLNFTNGNAFCKEFIVIDLDQNQKDKLQDKIDKYEDISEIVDIVAEKIDTVNLATKAIADKSAELLTPVAGIVGNTTNLIANGAYAMFKELQKSAMQSYVDMANNTYINESTLNAIDELKGQIKELHVNRKIAKKQKRVEKREERRAIRNSGRDFNMENNFDQYMM